MATETSSYSTPYVPAYMRPGYSASSGSTAKSGSGSGAAASLLLPLALIGGRYLGKHPEIIGLGKSAAPAVASSVPASVGAGGTSLVGSGGNAVTLSAEGVPVASGDLTGMATSGGSSLAGSTAAQIAGPLAAALGAYGIYDATKSSDKKRGALQGALSGTGMGAGIGTTLLATGALSALGPVGWALALGGGAALGGGLGGLLAHKSTKEIQRDRWKDLLENDFTGQKSFYEQMVANESSSPNYGGKIFSTSPEDYVGYWDDPSTSSKENIWVNNAFAESRDEKDLRPEDVWGSQDVMRLGGNDYLGKMTEEQRRGWNQAMLDAGLFREKKGGIYLTDESKAKDLLAKALGGA